MPNICSLNDAVLLLTANARGEEYSSVGGSISVALFTIAIVFLVLFIIFALLNIFTKFLVICEKENTPSTNSATANNATNATTNNATDTNEEIFSSGTLKLKGCDEKTAAMIMAIVSDNTGIPLSELIFKSITLVEKN